MKEQFVTYEIALALKELKYSPKVSAYYMGENLRMLAGFQSLDNLSWGIPAPLWQQVIDWFREKYEIYIAPFIQFENEVEDECDEEILNIYFILDLKEMRRNRTNFLPYIESTNLFENSEINDFYHSRQEAILKAIELCQKEK